MNILIKIYFGILGSAALGNQVEHFASHFIGGSVFDSMKKNEILNFNLPFPKYMNYIFEVRAL